MARMFSCENSSEILTNHPFREAENIIHVVAANYRERLGTSLRFDFKKYDKNNVYVCIHACM